MKRFVVATIVAVALGFGFASTADAQIVYGYSRPVGSGVVVGGQSFAPGGYQAFNSYFSPYTGVIMGQTYSSNFLGQSMMRSYGFNPWNGIGFNNGFYRPNFYMAPYGGYNYGYVRRWW